MDHVNEIIGFELVDNILEFISIELKRWNDSPKANFQFRSAC